jgi:hypothetical protein
MIKIENFLILNTLEKGGEYIMNKKIFFSGMSIVSAMALLAGVTYAQLSSPATATDITFASETANLLIAKDTVGGVLPTGDGLTAFEGTFEPTQSFNPLTHNIFPGYNQNFTFWLWNKSGADIPLTNAVGLGSYAASGVGEGDLTTNLTVGFNCTDEGPTGGGATANGNFPLSSWTPGNEDLGSLPSGDFALCTMNATVPTSVTSMTTGENVSFTATFTGTQVEPKGTPTPAPL